MTPSPREIEVTTNPQTVENSKPKKEILIDGVYYDVTSWAKIHPGGRVINYYTESGEDASIAYQQFHHRSIKKVEGIRRSLKTRVLTPQELEKNFPDLVFNKRQNLMTQGFKNLHSEFVAEGLFNPSYTHVFLRILEFVMYLTISIIILKRDELTLPIRTVGILFLALAYGRIVWLAHEGGHFSLLGNPKMDLYLQGFLYGFGNGLSASWWNHNHTKHHAMPQRIKRDVDLETLPLLAFTTKACGDFVEARNFFLKYQSILFLPLHTFLVTLRWTFRLHPKYCWFKRNYFELTCISLHFVPMIQVGIINFFIAKWLWSMYMFGNFSLSHTHLEVTEKPKHWIEYGFSHTINIKSTWFMDWWMGYLNFQIEHHLFPTMPQFRNPLIKERVKIFAEEFGLPYRELTYFQAVKETLGNLQKVSNEVYNNIDGESSKQI